MDRFGFKLLLYFITIIEIIIAGSFYFIAMNQIILLIYIFFVLICIGGTFSILSPEFNRIFGLLNGIEIYGIISFFIGTAHFIGCIFSRFLLKKNIHYILSFLILGSFCVIKIGILMFYEENKYISSKKSSKNTKERESIFTDYSF